MNININKLSTFIHILETFSLGCLHHSLLSKTKYQGRKKRVHVSRSERAPTCLTDSAGCLFSSVLVGS